MEAIRELVSDHRLVTLTGAGGCGKTRLAIQFAAQLVPEYADGVWMVELAPVEVPDYIDQAIAEVFMIKAQPGTTLIQLITHYLKSKKLLLILDNCEHLISQCTAVAERLLSACKDLKIIATSRESLGLPGERNYHVPSMELPDMEIGTLDPESIWQVESMQLFLDRARAVKLGYINKLFLNFLSYLFRRFLFLGQQPYDIDQASQSKYRKQYSP